MSEGLVNTTFDEIDLSDPFFDSLKAQYAEGFVEWFKKKQAAKEPVLVINEPNDGSLSGFVYTKVETGPITDVEPQLPPAKRLKVGTLKIIAHGTKLGERALKKIFDRAMILGVSEVYVTVFDTHQSLISLFERYGFEKKAKKNTKNGQELVLVKSLEKTQSSFLKDYPRYRSSGNAKWLLAVYPEYHSNLFPDSLLKTEKTSILEDVSHTNTIQKIYVAGIALTRISPGDIVVVYRTTDEPGRAKYRSVATSICVALESKKRSDFSNEQQFVDYCEKHSVFSEDQLREKWRLDKRLYTIKLLYNLALPKRPIRKVLMEDVGIAEQPRWDLKPLTDKQFERILELGEADENFIVD